MNQNALPHTISPTTVFRWTLMVWEPQGDSFFAEEKLLTHYRRQSRVCFIDSDAGGVHFPLVLGKAKAQGWEESGCLMEPWLGSPFGQGRSEKLRTFTLEPVWDKRSAHFYLERDFSGLDGRFGDAIMGLFMVGWPEAAWEF